MSKLTIYPPFGEHTSTHQDGLILVSCIVIIIFSLPPLAFAAVRSRQSLRWSIATTYIAVGLGISQSIPLLIGRKNGLGTSLEFLSQDQSRNSQYIFISEELYVGALGIHKCWIPVAAFYLTESSQKPMFKKGCSIVLAVASLWTVGSMVALGVKCSPQAMFPSGQSMCSDQFSRWLGIGITDTITDMVGFGLIFWLIRPLQIGLARKIAILCAFLMQIGCVPFSIAHLVAMHDYTSSSDSGVAIVKVLVWQNGQIGWAAISATAPSMLFLRKSYDDTLTTTDVPGLFGMSGSARGGSSGYQKGDSNSRSYVMGPISNRTQDRDRPALWPNRRGDSEASLIDGDE